MILEYTFELLVIMIALIHSRFSRLPLMVAGNIILFTGLNAFIEYKWNITVTPGYEIYYASGAMYFIIMAVIFFLVRNRFYALVGCVLTIQAFASALMLMNDGFYLWHEAINDKMLLLECILVWLSSVRTPCKTK